MPTAASPTRPSPNTLTPDRLRAIIAEELPGIIRIRRDLHAHPELSYQEHHTAGVVAAELARLGIVYKSGVASTGVLAYIPPTDALSAPAPALPAVALRADMDALPIIERTGAAHASITPGVMHACGHDGHTANLLGVARVLTRLASRPRGVLLIFQPAEEGGAGGKRMCDEGALRGKGAGGLGEPVGHIFGLHGWPQYPLGVVGSRPGPLLASTDNFTVKVVGEQAHAAYPQLSADPILTAAHIITALQSIASRSVAPQDSIVVTVAQINAGTASNIIPRELTFVGTMRTIREDTRELGRTRFFEIVQRTAAAFNCRAEIDWEEGYPVTHNDPALTERFFKVAERTLGADRVQLVSSPSMGGEDFSYYGHHVPACFFVLGVTPPGREKYPSLHQPEYDFNDDALATGIEVMVRLAVEE